MEVQSKMQAFSRPELWIQFIALLPSVPCHVLLSGISLILIGFCYF